MPAQAAKPMPADDMPVQCPDSLPVRENSLPVNWCGQHVHSRMGYVRAGGGDSVEVGPISSAQAGASPSCVSGDPQEPWEEPPLEGPLTGRFTPVSPAARCHGVSAVHRSPLLRLCQYLGLHGSRPAAGHQSTNRHSPRLYKNKNLARGKPER